MQGRARIEGILNTQTARRLQREVKQETGRMTIKDHLVGSQSFIDTNGK
jgi:hypothetical protein